MTAIFIKLLNMSISASWIVLAVLILRLLLKKAPKWITVILWGLVALRLVLPFSIESAFSLIPSAEAVDPEIIEKHTPETEVNTPVDNEANAPVVNETGSPIVSETVNPIPNETAPPVNVETVPPVVTVPSVPSVTVPPVVVVPPVSNVTVPPALDETNSPVSDETASPVVNETDTPVISDIQEPKPEKNTMQTVMNVISIVWLVGIAAMAIYTAVSYYLLRKKIDTAVRFRDNIYKSENVDSPFVVGVIKPKIYLPFNIKEQDTEYVIAHENAHIKRLDYIWKPLGFILLTVYWFNPVMWLGYILLCRDIELACDEKVIAGFDSEQRADYSEALLSCSVNRKVIAACPIAFGEVGVKDRIKSVLNYKKPALWVIILAVVAIIATALCFLTDPVSKKDSQENEETESGETDTPENSENTENEVSDLFLSVLKSKKTYINESGEAVYLKHYKDGTFVAYGGTYQYAMVDIDSDEKNEMVVKIPISSADVAIIMFRVYNSEVYGYEFGKDDISEVYTDGSIRQKDEQGIFKYVNLKFDGTSYQIIPRTNNGNMSFVKWNEYVYNIEWITNLVTQVDSPKAFNYRLYYDFLLDLCSNNPENIWGFFVKDLDNNGVDELIVGHKENVAYSVYTYDGGVKLVGKHEFLTGTTRLLETNDEAYPGLICFTVGGGANHYVYLTIKDGQLSFEKIWDDNYSGTYDTPTTEHTTDKKLIEISANAYNNNQDIDWVDLSLFAVLNNKQPYIDETGNTVYLKDSGKDAFIYTVIPGQFAMLDYNTMVVDTYRDKTGLLVLRVYNGNVYGYQFNFRQMRDLKKDGSFTREEHQNYPLTYDANLEFEGTAYKVVEKAFADPIMDIYRIGGVETTREEYIKYTEERSKVPYLRWIDYIDNTDDPDNEQLKAMYMDVLNSIRPFRNEYRESVYMKDYAQPAEYTTVDFDSDGFDEMVVKTSSADKPVIVFRLLNGNIYGMDFTSGKFQDLRTDGSFSSNNDSGSYVYSLEFFGTSSWRSVQKAYRNAEKNEYMLNGVAVSKEEMTEFYRGRNGHPAVNWVKYGTDTDNPGDALNTVFKDVLYNKRTFIDESGNAVYLKDHKFVFDGSSMPVIEYTTVDMNNDGEKELVINVGPEGNQEFVMVFRIYNGNVYGYQFGIRALHSIKTDGSYWASSGAFENSILKLEFEGTSYKCVELEYSNSIDNVYRLNGSASTNGETRQYEEAWNQLEDVIWTDYSTDTDRSDADEKNGTEQMLFSVLRNETKFFSADENKDMYFSDYLLEPSIYSIVDLDSDNEKEAVVFMRDGRTTFVFRRYGEKIKGFELAGTKEIWKGGLTFGDANGGRLRIYSKLVFTNDSCEEIELRREDQSLSGEVTYYVGGKVVSESEYIANAESTATNAGDRLKWNGWEKLLKPDEKYISEIDKELNEKIKLPEYSSNGSMSSLYVEYGNKWIDVSEKYYSKLLLYGMSIKYDNKLYTPDEWKAYISELKTNWNKSYWEKSEEKKKELDELYDGGSLCGLLYASYQYDLKKEWALSLIELHTVIFNAITKDGYEGLYMQFLAGNVPAEDESGNIKYIEKYLPSYSEKLDDWYSYAFFDTDNDSIPEMYFRKQGILYCFTIEEGSVFEYHTDAGLYLRVLDNGAILWDRPGVAPEHRNYIYTEISPSGSVRKEITFEWWLDPDDNSKTYKFLGEEVSKEEYDIKTKPYLTIGQDKTVWHTHLA